MTINRQINCTQARNLLISMYFRSSGWGGRKVSIGDGPGRDAEPKMNRDRKCGKYKSAGYASKQSAANSKKAGRMRMA
jgi:hypothetical protein